MADKKREEKVEALKNNADIVRELEQTGGTKPEKKPSVEKKHKFWFLIYALSFPAFVAVYQLSNLGYFGFAESYRPAIQKFCLGGISIILLLALRRFIRVFLIGRVAARASQYNLNRIITFLVWAAILFIVLSLFFANWYTAVVSLGLISLVVGFALQTLISSFFGWIYILVKVPYKVGDRIKIDEASGDVIDVSYLDTTLWEFGGQHLSTDHPSGRIIKFPNAKVLNSTIYNYSWPLFPYIWNDIKFQIAYQSDLDFVAQTMREAALEEVGEAMMERIRTYRELLEQTPVDQLEVREHPAVVFRVGENTWIEAICRYLVEPRNAGTVKTRLIKKMLERLNAAPDKVMFPKGDMR